MYKFADGVEPGGGSPGIEPLPQLPGRGEYTEDARLERLQFLREQTGVPLAALQETSLDATRLVSNVENLFASVEVPVGVAGPLLFQGKEARGLIYLPMATTEGALVASTCRGATAISRSGGVTTAVLKQRMIRAPIFEFSGLQASMRFCAWIEESLPRVRELCRQVSSHANLVTIEPFVLGRVVHARFIYETGDAAGQNMTTACTWHACQWILGELKRIGQAPKEFYIEANASGDKKLTYLSFLSGRGTRVIAECFLTRRVIEQTLKTTPELFMEGYYMSQSGASASGMVGHSINVANVLAAVFIATGQDVACVHESGAAQFTMKAVDGGVYASMVLPSLVVGTVGGGTHLGRQRAMLEMLGCAGEGKSARLAEIIAGYALALDLSTGAAITSGQFAAAHERLGRNRPVRFFTPQEITPALLKPGLARALGDSGVEPRSVEPLSDVRLGSSILTAMASQKLNKAKVIGHFPMRIHYAQCAAAGGAEADLDVMVKIKPLDEEVLLAVSAMASLCSERVRAAYRRFKRRTGFVACHVRELAVCEQTDPRFVAHTPALYLAHRDDAREAYVLVTELLKDMVLMDTADDTSGWRREHIAAALSGIAEVHAIWYGREAELQAQPWLGPTWSAADLEETTPLWEALVDEAAEQFPDWFSPADVALHRQVIATIPEWAPGIDAMPKTLIHNDFNPRNIALRANHGQLRLCAYDWELATLHLPQHDLAELLSFVLTPEATREEVQDLVELHRTALEKATGRAIDPAVWRAGYALCLNDLLINRGGLYLMGHAFRRYGFLPRVIRTLRHLIRLSR